MILAVVPDIYIGSKVLIVLVGFCVGLLLARGRRLTGTCVIVGLVFAVTSVCFLHFNTLFIETHRNWHQSQRIGELQAFIGIAVGFFSRLMCPPKD